MRGKMRLSVRKALAALLAGIMCVSVLPIDAITVHAEEIDASSAFTLESTSYGILDSAVTGQKLTLAEGASLADSHMKDGFCFVQQGTRWYLVGVGGCAAVFEGESEPEAGYISGRTYDWNGDVLTRGFRPSIFRIQDPATGKYGIFCVADGKYYDYQLDDTCGTFYVKDGMDGYLCKVEKDGKYGVIKPDGSMLYEPAYDKIDYSSESYFVGTVKSEDGENVYAVLTPDGKTDGTVFYTSIISDYGQLVTVKTSAGYQMLSMLTGESFAFTAASEYDIGFLGEDCGWIESGDDVFIVSADGSYWSACEELGKAEAYVDSSTWSLSNLLKTNILPIYWRDGEDGRYFLADQNGIVDELRDRSFESEDLYGEMKTTTYNECSTIHGYYENIYLWEAGYDPSISAEGPYYLTDSDRKVLLDGLKTDTFEVMGNYLFLHKEDGYFLYDPASREIAIDKVDYYSVNMGYAGVKDEVICLYEDDNEQRDSFGLFDLQTGKFSGFIYSLGEDDSYPGVSVQKNGDRSVWMAGGYIINDQFQKYSIADDWSFLWIDPDLNMVFEERLDQSDQLHILNYEGQETACFQPGYSYEPNNGTYRPVAAYREDQGEGSERYGLIRWDGEILSDAAYDKIQTNPYGISVLFESEPDWYGYQTAWSDGGIGEMSVMNETGTELLQGVYEVHRDAYYLLDAYWEDYNGGIADREAVVLRDGNDSDSFYIYNFTEALDVSTLRFRQKKKLTEDDLFGEYSKYLYNKTYNKMCNTLHADMAEINANRTGMENARSVLKSNMKNGGISSFINAMYCQVTGKYYNQNELERTAALEVVKALKDDASVMGTLLDDTMSTVKDEFKYGNTMYEILSNGFKTISEKREFAKRMAKNSDGFWTESEILENIRETDENWKEIDGIFKKAEFAINNAEIVTTVIVTAQANHEIVTQLMDLIDVDSALYRGLKQLDQYQKETLGTMVWELVKFNGMEKIVDLLEDQGVGRLASLFANTGGIEVGGAVTIANLVFEVASCLVPGGGSDDVMSAIISVSNQSVLYCALSNEFERIRENYTQNLGIPVSTLKKEYSLLYRAYLISLKNGVEASKKVALDGGLKENLETDYKNYGKKLSYGKYIKSCLVTANAAWTYTEQNGTIQLLSVKISGQTARTMPMEHSAVGEEEGEDGFCVDIPDEVYGKEVTQISSGALADISALEGVTVPESVTVIGEGAFRSCDRLDTVFLGSRVMEIGDKAFENCSAITSLTLPVSVSTIGANAFCGIESVELASADTSRLEEYALSHENVTVQSCEKEVREIQVQTLPDKLDYTMSELEMPVLPEDGTVEAVRLSSVDPAGLVLAVTYEDGSTAEITEGYGCDFEEKKTGECNVVVCYEGCTTTYPIVVTGDLCEYSVSYTDLLGNVLAQDSSGEAMAGTEISLEIKDIEGYTPVQSAQTEVIGADNDFTVYYTRTEKPDLSSAAIADIPPVTYTGSQLCPQVTVRYNGKTLRQDVDYRVEYENNIHAGKALMMISGAGDYAGVLWKEFTILQKSIQGGYLHLDKTTFTYTGKEIVPSFAVKTDGRQPTSGKDYTVSYSANKSVGTARIMVTARGDYTGTLTSTFTINPRGTKLKKLTPGKKSFKVTWKKQSKEISGYEIRYSLKKKMKKAKTVTVKGKKASAKTVKKLKAKKTYYVQIRTFKKVGGKKYCSAWSNAKKVRVK